MFGENLSSLSVGDYASVVLMFSILRFQRRGQGQNPCRRSMKKLYANKPWLTKKREFIDEMYGEECFFCGHQKVGIIHKKDGIPHQRLILMGWDALHDLKANHKEEYVRLCGLCHAGVHWCMKRLSLTWEDIVERDTIKT